MNIIRYDYIYIYVLYKTVLTHIEAMFLGYVQLGYINMFHSCSSLGVPWRTQWCSGAGLWNQSCARSSLKVSEEAQCRVAEAAGGIYRTYTRGPQDLGSWMMVELVEQPWTTKHFTSVIANYKIWNDPVSLGRTKANSFLSLVNSFDPDIHLSASTIDRTQTIPKRCLLISLNGPNDVEIPR